MSSLHAPLLAWPNLAWLHTSSWPLEDAPLPQPTDSGGDPETRAQLDAARANLGRLWAAKANGSSSCLLPAPQLQDLAFISHKPTGTQVGRRAVGLTKGTGREGQEAR